MSVAFYKSDLALLDHINRANGYSTVAAQRFTTDTVFISKPAPVSGTWMEETSTENTYIRISARETAPFKGRTLVSYNRLDLGDFAKFREVRKLPAYLPETTKDLLPNILFYFAIYLDPSEIVDEPLALEDGYGTVIIKMKPDALIFTGEVSFEIIPGGAIVRDFMDTIDLDGLHYPVDNPITQVSALLYTYPLDLSEQRDSLIDIEEGELSDIQAQAIVDCLKLIDLGANKLTWNASAELNTWSLQGATVVYNGLNSLGLASNQKYKYVMELTLRSEVTTPTGSFFLHYSDPFDPDLVEQ